GRDRPRARRAAGRTDLSGADGQARRPRQGRDRPDRPVAASLSVVATANTAVDAAGNSEHRPQRSLIVSRIKLLSFQVLVAVVALGAWQLLATVPIFDAIVLPPFFFSTPIDIAARIYKLFATGMVWNHLWVTLVESILAFVLGSLMGVLVGFWFARQPAIAAVCDPYVKMTNALPRVVLGPIFTLWFGLGIASKVALGITLVFFIVFFNVYQGVREVSPTILANARMLGMNERQLMRYVYWPSALSWMFSSLHTSVGFAVVGAVVGEYLGSAAGLGYLIQSAEGNFDVDGVFAGMFVLAAFVLAIDALVSMVERRLLVWRPTAAETRGA